MQTTLPSLQRWLLSLLALTAFSVAGLAQKSTHESIEVDGHNKTVYEYEVADSGNPVVSGVSSSTGTAYSEVSVPTSSTEYRVDYDIVGGVRKVRITFGGNQPAGKTVTVTTTRSGGSTPTPTNETWS